MDQKELDELFGKLQSEPIGEGTYLVYWDSNDPGCGPEGPLHLSGWWWSKEPAFLINCFIRLQLSVSFGKRFGVEEDGLDRPLEEMIGLAEKQELSEDDKALIASLQKWEGDLKEEADPKKRIALFNALSAVLKGKGFHLKAKMFGDYKKAIALLERHGAEFDESDPVSSFQYDQCEDDI